MKKHKQNCYYLKNSAYSDVWEQFFVDNDTYNTLRTKLNYKLWTLLHLRIVFFLKNDIDLRDY